jgi:hypothetical protein
VLKSKQSNYMHKKMAMERPIFLIVLPKCVPLRLTQIIGHDPVQAKVTFLVGSGNNGRDALFTALLLRALQPTWQLSLYFAKPLNADDPIFNDLMKAEVFMVMAGDDQQYRVLQNLIATSQVVVDAAARDWRALTPRRSHCRYPPSNPTIAAAVLQTVYPRSYRQLPHQS